MFEELAQASQDSIAPKRGLGHGGSSFQDPKGRYQSRSCIAGNKAHGTAMFTYGHGAYDGQYIIKKHGEGRYISYDGSMYEGEWEENQITGLG